MKKNYLIYLIFISGLILFAFSAQKAAAADCPVSVGICPAFVTGSCTLATSCVIPDGGFMTVNGDLIINSGVTLTMDTNSALIFTPTYSIYTNGSIAIASGAVITKKVMNSASDISCNAVCSNLGMTCASIGQDAYATDTYYWGASVCEGAGSCSYIAGNCSTVMSDQCPGAINASCCGIDVYWTRCSCVSP